MKNLVFILIGIFILNSGILIAQNEIDSLKQLLKSTPYDTTRLRVMFQISELYQNDSTNALSTAHKAIDLAKKMGKKYEIQAFNNLAITYKNLLDYNKAIKISNIAIQKALKLKDKEEIASCYFWRGHIFYQINQMDSSMFFHQNALKIYKTLSNKLLLARSLNAIGVMFWRKGLLDSAEIYYLQSIKIRKTLNDWEGESTVYNNLGAMHWGFGNYNTALKYFLQAMELSKKINNRERTVLILNNIGLIYQELGHIEKALIYHTEAEELSKKIDYPYGLAYTYINIGTCLVTKKNYKKAIEKFEYALHFYSIDKKIIGKSFALRHLGVTYLQIGDYKKAIHFLKQSLGEAKKMNSIHHITIAHQYLGLTFFKERNYSKALVESKLAYELSVANNYKENIKESSFNLSDIYEAQGDFKNSLKYYKIASEIKDSIFSEKKTKQIAEMQAKYESDKQSKEIELQKSELAKKNSEIKRNEIQQRSLFYGLFATIFIGLLIVVGNIRIKKAKHKIQLQKIELEKVNSKLLELSNFKNTLIGMVVHDLKNPLNIISNSNNLQQIKEPVSRMYNLVMNLLDIQKFEESKMKVEFTEIDLNQIIDSASKQIEMLLKRKNIQFNNLIHKQLIITSDIELLERILINLLHNAAKYTPNNGAITLNYKYLKNEKIELTINNTGEKIPEEQLERIFKKYEQYKPLKDGYSASTGLGLSFCSMAMRAMNENISVKSTIETGTSFLLTFSLFSESKKDENLLSMETPVLLKYTPQDRALIQEYAKKLQIYEIYEISNLKVLLDIAKEQKQKGFLFWLSELENSILSLNDTKYKELLNFENITND